MTTTHIHQSPQYMMFKYRIGQTLRLTQEDVYPVIVKNALGRGGIKLDFPLTTTVDDMWTAIQAQIREKEPYISIYATSDTDKMPFVEQELDYTIQIFDTKLHNYTRYVLQNLNAEKEANPDIQIGDMTIWSYYGTQLGEVQWEYTLNAILPDTI